jgi:CRISPR/Cas system endoribonuclease Cas6 (RAMP superfamily)
MSKGVDFNKLNKVKKTAQKKEIQEFSHFTVRIDKKDANRLKYLFSDNNHSIQSGVVESINAYLEKLGEKPIVDYGTGRIKEDS